jgi:hypothetical protein
MKNQISNKNLFLLAFLFSCFFCNAFATGATNPLASFGCNQEKCKVATSVFDIKRDIVFEGFTVYGKVNITPRFLKKLSRATINAGGSKPDGVESSDGEHVVKNCIDFAKYDLSEDTTYAMLDKYFFEDHCGILKYLKKIKQPKHSFVHDIYIADSRYLPLDLLKTLEVDKERVEGYQKQHITIKDLIRNKTLSLKKHSNYSIELTDDAMERYISEIVRGDFDGSGEEKILVSIVSCAVGGTMELYDLCLFYRKQNKGPLQMEC